MRKASKNDKKRVVDIISESFDQNPSVNWVIRNDSKRKKRIRQLADYSFETALSRDGVYLSDDGNGVALCYQYSRKGNFLADLWNQLKLVILAVGISRVPKVMKRESFIKQKRPKSGNFLYFWFFGVNSNGRGKGAARELKNFIFGESANQKLDIYLETSVYKNKLVYERYGFEAYHIWEDKTKDVKIWFMRRKY